MTIPNSTGSPSAAAYVAAPLRTSVPIEIAGVPQYVVWKPARQNPKPSKIPHNPLTGYPASVANPDHWSDLLNPV